MRDILDQNAPQVLPDRGSRNALSIEGILPLLEHRFKTRKSVSLTGALSLPLLVPQGCGCVDTVDISFGESVRVSQELR